MAIKVIEKNGAPDFRKIVTRLRSVSSLDVRVGFIQGVKQDRKDLTGQDSGLTNASIAHVHEFGAPSRGIPARPFLGPAWRANEQFAIDRVGHAVTLSIAGKTDAVRKSLATVGMKVVADAKRNIVEQVGFAPLSPKTLDYRASIKFTGTKSLIHTGQLLNAITYKVRDA